jgi:hypothetical protein
MFSTFMRSNIFFGTASAVINTSTFYYDSRIIELIWEK